MSERVPILGGPNNGQENFQPVAIGEGKLFVPAHVANERAAQFMAPHEYTADNQEMKAQAEVIGWQGQGSLRAEEQPVDTSAEELDRAAQDMLRPENILDLKAAYDARVAKARDERSFKFDGRTQASKDADPLTSVDPDPIKSEMVDAYTQVGAPKDKPREIPEKLRGDVERMMDLSYDELEARVKANKQAEIDAMTGPERAKALADAHAEGKLSDKQVDEVQDIKKQIEDALKGAKAPVEADSAPTVAEPKHDKLKKIEIEVDKSAEKVDDRTGVDDLLDARRAGADPLDVLDAAAVRRAAHDAREDWRASRGAYHDQRERDAEARADRIIQDRMRRGAGATPEAAKADAAQHKELVAQAEASRIEWVNLSAAAFVGKASSKDAEAARQRWLDAQDALDDRYVQFASEYYVTEQGADEKATEEFLMKELADKALMDAFRDSRDIERRTLELTSKGNIFTRTWAKLGGKAKGMGARSKAVMVLGLGLATGFMVGAASRSDQGKLAQLGGGIAGALVGLQGARMVDRALPGYRDNGEQIAATQAAAREQAIQATYDEGALRAPGDTTPLNYASRDALTGHIAEQVDTSRSRITRRRIGAAALGAAAGIVGAAASGAMGDLNAPDMNMPDLNPFNDEEGVARATGTESTLREDIPVGNADGSTTDPEGADYNAASGDGLTNVIAGVTGMDNANSYQAFLDMPENLREQITNTGEMSIPGPDYGVEAPGNVHLPEEVTDWLENWKTTHNA